ncbi:MULTISPECIES: formate dehydrogenase accessory sulfurtransferase FdhD [Burkholderiaceae]|uniref:formate dehydrogenase accessory sulfurtransferase FdhD n=1 Tax=Burkholderiaceae TaxID=119060 RepID=UPI001EF0B39B|nr:MULTISPECIES: formate dehydrogenase accessory sulfurtransferase FdhD [Burkholderiaceae]
MLPMPLHTEPRAAHPHGPDADPGASTNIAGTANTTGTDTSSSPDSTNPDANTNTGPISRNGVDIDADTGKSGLLERPVLRTAAGGRRVEHDVVADEVPVALVFNGISHAVMMCTPRDLDLFAVGFALTEGIVSSGSEIHDIEVLMYDEGYAQVQLTLVQHAFASLKDRRRALAGRTGCGVCGIESVQLLDLEPERVEHTGFLQRLATDALACAVRELPAHQPLMQACGGVHAASWCDAHGTIRYAFEDVGRHNALDKLIGQLVLAREDMRDGFVFLSSRASYELVRKCARVSVPMVATISAPTALAVSIAAKAGIRLVSFCRESGYVEYSAPAPPR